MKIGGPKAPPPVTGPQSPKEPTGVERPAVSFDEVLASHPVNGAAAPDLVAQLAEQVRAGQLAPGEAADRLVDEVIARRKELLPPAARERLRAALRQVLADDPVLAARLRGLEG